MRVGTIAAFAAVISGALWAQHAAAQDAVLPSSPPPGAPGAPPPAVVGTNVNLRQGPGTNYTIITLIPAGAPVNVSGCNAGWCQISFAGQNGYIIATAIAPPGDGSGEPPPDAVAGPPSDAPPPGYYPPGYYPPPPLYYYGYGPYYGGYYGRPYWRGGYYGHRRW